MVGSSPTPWQEKHCVCPESSTGMSGAGASEGDATGVLSAPDAVGDGVASALLAGVMAAPDAQAAMAISATETTKMPTVRAFTKSFYPAGPV